MNMPSSSLRDRLNSGTARPTAQRGAIDNRAYHQLKSRIHEALLDRVPVGPVRRGAELTVIATGARLPKPWTRLVSGVRGEILRLRFEEEP